MHSPVYWTIEWKKKKYGNLAQLTRNEAVTAIADSSVQGFLLYSTLVGGAVETGWVRPGVPCKFTVA